jgi:hypothetical protein
MTSTVTGALIRRTGTKGPKPNGRKEWIVIRRDTYVGASKMWNPTLPLTINQACEAHNYFSQWDETEVKMITLKEWAQMQKVAND